jgi:hypothetical protein
MYWKSHQMFLERFQPYGLSPSALATCYAMAENVFAVSQGGIDRPVTVDRITQRGLLVDRIAWPAKNDDESINMLSAGQPIDNTHVRVVDQRHTEIPDRTSAVAAQRRMLTDTITVPISAQTFVDGWQFTDSGHRDGEIYVLVGKGSDHRGKIFTPRLEVASDVHGVYPGRWLLLVFPVATGTEDVVIIAEVDLKIPIRHPD